jgi:hypothetical protein
MSIERQIKDQAAEIASEYQQACSEVATTIAPGLRPEFGLAPPRGIDLFG